jgi:Zn-finger nucleic acid-binding protein
MSASQETHSHPCSPDTSERTMAIAPACPNCRSTTAPRSWSDLFGYECVNCSGLWIPGQTLAYFSSIHPRVPKHEELLDRANRSELSKRPLQCPHCRAPYLRGLGAVGVELDMCGTCGGCYLDGEEVKAFLGAGRSGKISVMDGVIGVLSVLP